jgi:hypothetical protein
VVRIDLHIYVVGGHPERKSTSGLSARSDVASGAGGHDAHDLESAVARVRRRAVEELHATATRRRASQR